MKVVFFGTPQFAVPSLERLLQHSAFEVLAVVTQPDKRRGRGNQLIPSAIKKVADMHQITVKQPTRLKKDKETQNLLQQTEADAFVVVAYGQLLPSNVLKMPKLGCVNVHGSILPQYRGAAPIQWSIYHGDTQTGVTTMLIDEGMDSGAMLLKAYTPIKLLDNTQQIAITLASQGADLLVETLLKLEKGEIEPIPQNPEEATYAPLIQKSDYVIDWGRSAWQIHNQVRALYPECVTTFRKQALKITATAPLGETYWKQLPPEIQKLQQQWTSLVSLAGRPGEVVKIIKNLGPVVNTGEGLLLLLQVQLAGKRPQSGWDFVNGTRLTVGELIINS